MFKFFLRFASSRRPLDGSGDPRARALALLEGGHAGEAAAAFGELLAREHHETERAFLLNKYGVALVRSGRKDQGRLQFEAALALRPDYAPALANLGNLALEAGQPLEAVAKYEAAIAADEQYAVAHFNLSVAYKRLGRYGEAVKALRAAQKLEGRSRRKAR